MDLIFLRDWIRAKADDVNLSYSEIETLFDVNDLLNADLPLMMFNYEQEENQYQESPFTTINLKLYFIQNFHDAVKTESADYQRDYLVTQKNILRQHYLDFIEQFQRDETPIIEILSDTQIQIAEKVSIEGFLIMEANLRLNVERDFCLLVSGEPLPPACADATYIVEYEDGTLIQQGSIPSGGSVTVVVPDVIVCQDANWQLLDSNGTELQSGTVASGGSVTITAPDATVELNGTFMVSVPSGGTENIRVRQQQGSTEVGQKQGQHWRIDNSDITLNDSQGNEISTTSVPAEENETIVAPDASYNVEYADGTPIESGTIVSGGSVDVEVPNIVKDLKNQFKVNENDTFVSYTIEAEDVGTISSIDNGGLTNIVIEVESVVVTPPFTLSLNNSLEITFDAATTDTQIKLIGSYV